MIYIKLIYICQYVIFLNIMLEQIITYQDLPQNICFDENKL